MDHFKTFCWNTAAEVCVCVWERVGRKSVACIHDDIYILYKQQQRRNICVCSHVRTPATDCIFRYVCEHTMLLGSNMCCYGNSHFLGGFDVSHVVTQVRGDFFFSFISEGHQTMSVLISLCFRFFNFFCPQMWRRLSSAFFEMCTYLVLAWGLCARTSLPLFYEKETQVYVI